MQLVNALVSLGGDTRNTVPKTAITIAEVQVLRAIHGDDAVHDITPLGRSVKNFRWREEVARLAGIYAGRDPENRPVVATLFAGGASSMYETIEDLDLPESLFAVTERVKPTPAPKKATKKVVKKKVVEDEDDEPENSADALFDDGDDDGSIED